MQNSPTILALYKLITTCKSFLHRTQIEAVPVLISQSWVAYLIIKQNTKNNMCYYVVLSGNVYESHVQAYVMKDPKKNAAHLPLDQRQRLQKIEALKNDPRSSPRSPRKLPVGPGCGERTAQPEQPAHVCGHHLHSEPAAKQSFTRRLLRRRKSLQRIHARRGGARGGPNFQRTAPHRLLELDDRGDAAADG